MEIKIGCCGFARGKRNYFKKFKVVEIQQTFYKPPPSDYARQWKLDAPNEFEFTVKAWQLITHTPKSPTYRRAEIVVKREEEDKLGSFKPTKEVFSAWEEILKICEILDSKVIVFQCPASLKPTNENINNMKIFFSTIDRAGLMLVWEPRGNWPEYVIKDICHDFKLTHCVDPFKDNSQTTKTAYFRLHGSPPGKKMYNYRYSKKDLKDLYEICSGFDKVYCMFNNFYMYENALEFLEMVSDGL